MSSRTHADILRSTRICRSTDFETVELLAAEIDNPIVRLFRLKVLEGNTDRSDGLRHAATLVLDQETQDDG